MTNPNLEVITRESQKDEVMRDILHGFADRERHLRNGELTTHGLANRMSREGFEYSERDLARHIKFLADAGLGVLAKTDNGKVLGLKHVTVDIKSFARAVLERDETKIQTAPKRNRYVKFSTEGATVEAKKEPVPAPMVFDEPKGAPPVAPAPSPAMDVQVSLKSGTVVKFSLPVGNQKAVTEIMEVIAKLA